MASTDLHSQLEALLDAVWEAERNWQLDDLIDLRVGTPPTERLGDHGNWKDFGWTPPKA